MEPRKHGWRRGARRRAGDDGERVIQAANLIPEISMEEECFLHSGWNRSERSSAKLRQPQRLVDLFSETRGAESERRALPSKLCSTNETMCRCALRATRPPRLPEIRLCCWLKVDESRCSPLCVGAAKCIQLLLCSGPLLSGRAKIEKRHTSLTFSLS